MEYIFIDYGDVGEFLPQPINGVHSSVIDSILRVGKNIFVIVAQNATKCYMKYKNIDQ